MGRKNIAEPRTLEHIKNNPFCTVKDIVSAIGVSQPSVLRAVSNLTKRGEIHVAIYERLHAGSGAPSRQFLYGPGENAKPPRPTKAQKRIAKSEWQRKKRARLAVMQRAAQNDNVFGVLIAQIMK